MKYETTNSQVNASATDRYKEHQAVDDALGTGPVLRRAASLTGSASDRLDVTALEQVLNRGSKTGDQLISLRMELARLVEKLDGPMPGGPEQGETPRQSGLIGFANDQQDRIDALVSDCTGLVSRLSGLI